MHQPTSAQRLIYRTLGYNFNFNLGRDYKKKFLCASRLLVCRRKEPILSYVTKNDEKKGIWAEIG